MKSGKKQDFKGDILKKDIKEQEENLKIKREEIKGNEDQFNEKETEDEKILNTIKDNTFFVLNERNCIIFVLSVINEISDKKQRKLQGEIVGHLSKIVRKKFEQLIEAIKDKQNVYKLKYWGEFTQSSAYKNLEHFLNKEEVIVKYEL